MLSQENDECQLVLYVGQFQVAYFIVYIYIGITDDNYKLFLKKYFSKIYFKIYFQNIL